MKNKMLNDFSKSHSYKFWQTLKFQTHQEITRFRLNQTFNFETKLQHRYYFRLPYIIKDSSIILEQKFGFMQEKEFVFNVTFKGIMQNDVSIKKSSGVKL